MRYPKINNWLVFSITKSGEYQVIDYLYDKSYEFGSQIGFFAKCLDGNTDPFSIFPDLSDREVAALLRTLDKYGFLRRSRILKTDTGKWYFTLWTPKSIDKKNTVSMLLNRLLQILFLPIFALGLVTFHRTLPELHGGMIDIVCILGVLAGLLFHEIAHSIAALAYGGRVFELGIFLSIPFPGAYVLMDTSSIKGTLKKVQISAAGIEANLLLSGIMFFLATVASGNSNVFFCVAIINVELALMNLLLIGSLDGAGIMSTLLGVESLLEDCKSYCLNLIRGIRILHNTKSDMVFSTVCLSTIMIQPVYVVLVVLNVLGVVEWLF